MPPMSRAKNRVAGGRLDSVVSRAGRAATGVLASASARADTAHMPRRHPTVEHDSRPQLASAQRVVYVRLTHAHDQWYAEAADFRIVGIGASRRAALDRMSETLAIAWRLGGRSRGFHRQLARPEVLWTAMAARVVALLSMRVPPDRRAVLRLRLPT